MPPVQMNVMKLSDLRSSIQIGHLHFPNINGSKTLVGWTARTCWRTFNRDRAKALQGTFGFVLVSWIVSVHLLDVAS